MEFEAIISDIRIRNCAVVLALASGCCRDLSWDTERERRGQQLVASPRSRVVQSPVTCDDVTQDAGLSSALTTDKLRTHMLESVLYSTQVQQCITALGTRQWSLDWTFGDRRGWGRLKIPPKYTNIRQNVVMVIKWEIVWDQGNVSSAVTRRRLLPPPVAGAERPELWRVRSWEWSQSQERTWSWHKTRLVSFTQSETCAAVTLARTGYSGC